MFKKEIKAKERSKKYVPDRNIRQWLSVFWTRHKPQQDTVLRWMAVTTLTIYSSVLFIMALTRG